MAVPRKGNRKEDRVIKKHGHGYRVIGTHGCAFLREYLALKVYELGVFFYVSKLPYNSIERLFLYCLNNVL